jgi:arylsulfatase
MPGPADTYIAYGQPWANVSNTPFREYKHFVHEGGIATPLIAHWPDHIKRHGELESQPAHLIDIMATCVDLSGANYPMELNGKPITPMEGTSLLPAFDGEQLKSRALFWEHEGNRAMRDGDWKLVATYPAGKWELYNMAEDRTEMHDLATKEPERLKSMIAQWEAWGKRVHALPWPWEPQYGESPEQSGPAHVVLNLKPNDDIAGEKAPILVGRAITITATLDTVAPEGVIVAQGGRTCGYTLYMQQGKLYFAARTQAEIATISTKEPLPESAHTITATLAKDATMTLKVDDEKVARGKAAHLLDIQPKDGLQVGRDKAGAVGEYTAPFPYRGTIQSVKIEMSAE